MHYLVLLGALVNILGTIVYIRDTLKGRTKPNRVTWVLWSVIPMIAFAAELKAGIGWSAVSVFIAGFTPFMVLCASFFNRQAYWKLGTLDYLCGLLSIVAIVLWLYTEEPSIAIVFAIVADALAATPTMLKAWAYPHTESGSTYMGGLFSGLMGVAVLPAYSFSGLAFLTYVIVQNSVTLIFIYGRGKYREV